MSEQEKLRVEKHTVDCELCSDALEGYSQMNDPAGFGLRIASIDRKIDAKLSVESRFWNREKLSYIAAAAVLLMFCSIVFVLIDDVSQETNQFVTDELKQYEYEQNIPKEERTPFYDTESADKTVNNQNLAAEAAARKGDRAGNKDKNQDVAAQVPTSGKLEGSLKEMNESEIGNRSRYLGATRAAPSEPEPDMIDEISIESSADRVAAGATGTVTYGWNKADNDEALTEDVVLYDLERSGDERKDAKPAKKDK
ncbi:MAG: hypothetical protein IIB38_13725, partial [Candidatus Hydrogenedentes bacterium]|nr:hypothetical protein [Candidatus Hydrogenedentota bacterium]